MTTFIDLGPVPSFEPASSEPVRAVQLASAFVRQLNRVAPLPDNKSARYYLAQCPPGRVPWVTVHLAVPVNSWTSADDAHELAGRARAVDRWDAQALCELQAVADRDGPVIPRCMPALA